MITRIYMLIILILSSFSTIVTAEQVHILKKNETLYSLARQYDISVDELVRINNIHDVHSLKVGTRIIISGNVHHVQKGDTLYGIARKYGISLVDLLKANGLNREYLLKTGDILRIPGEPATETVEAEREVPLVEEEIQKPDEEKQITEISSIEPRDWPIVGDPIPADGKLSGVTIKGEEGDPVRTISSGIVVWVGPYRGFGKVVLIQSSDRYVYVYGGNAAIGVEVGQEVRPGMVISTLGKNPHSKKPELFFSVFRNGKPVDPIMAPRG